MKIQAAEDKFEIILPSGEIQRYASITVTDVLYYTDGGTTGIIIKDQNGKVLKLCLDGRMQIQEILPGAVVKPKPYHIYVGATYPTDQGAQSVSIGGKEEKTILSILQAWVNGQSPFEKQEKLMNAKTVQGLSENELKEYRILNVIKTLKNR